MAKLNYSVDSIENTTNKARSSSAMLEAAEIDPESYPSCHAVVSYVNQNVSDINDSLEAAISTRPIPGDYIVARHRNANWDWVEYASGWCECHGYKDISERTTTTTWGVVYEGTPGIQLTYPVTFSGKPYELAQCNCDGGTWTEAYVRNTSTTSSFYYPIRPNVGVAAGYLYIYVAGYKA